MHMNDQTVSMIAAIGKNRGIGKEGSLLWRIPDDLKRFKTLTDGHSVIMGRTTFESIGKPLPNRRNIVLSSNEGLSIDGVTVVHSPEEALKEAGDGEVFVIGGARVYELFLPQAHTLYLTLIDDEKDADTFFPDYGEFTEEEFVGEEEWDGLKYRWANLTRQQTPA